jgi:SAM-dependent methyltransferase
MSAPSNLDTDHDIPQPDLSDQDSTFGDRSRPSSTETLPSSILDYQQKHGRTYHNYRGCQYLFPNDEWELERLDFQHEIFLRLFDGELFLAPISPSPQNILDIGTGTGIWAIDMADKYPSAIVIGIDISPTQPNWGPPNCKFQADNANDDWTFTQQFDFIHCRQLFMAVEERRLFQQSFDALKEGGWLEIKEFVLPWYCVDNTLNGTDLAT